jgi:hypothetical protein
MVSGQFAIDLTFSWRNGAKIAHSECAGARYGVPEQAPTQGNISTPRGSPWKRLSSPGISLVGRGTLNR